MKAGNKQPKRERRRSPVRRPREEQVLVSPCARPAAVAAARAEAEEAVAPVEGHGHSANEVEFLGHLEDNRAWWDQMARDKTPKAGIQFQTSYVVADKTSSTKNGEGEETGPSTGGSLIAEERSNRACQRQTSRFLLQSFWMEPR